MPAHADGPAGAPAISARLGFAVIACVSASVMLAEVSVTRILSYRLFYHFVYMVISTALLGLSGAASVVARRAFRGRPLGREALGRACAGFAVLSIVVLFALTQLTPRPNRSTGKIDGQILFLYLPVCYVLLTAQFFAAGVAVAILFAELRAQVARLYFWDLLGAACAAVTAVPIMKAWTPLCAFLLAGTLAAAMATALASSRRGRALSLGLAVLCGSLTVIGQRGFDPGNNLLGVLNQPSDWKWTHQARVDRLGSLFVIDSDASTNRAPLFDGPGDASLKPINPFYELSYQILGRPRPEVLVIGAGGGVDIYNALRNQAAHVVAVELNEIIYDWMMDEPRSVYHKPIVEPILGEGRHTLSALGRSYDLIQLSLIDTYTASAQGAYALSENFLYTVDAFEEYLRHLKPGGLLFISRWEFSPPRETLRLCTMADAALRRLGVTDPGTHVAVISDKGSEQKRRSGFLLSRDPLDAAALERLATVTKSQGYGILYRPGATPDNAFSRFFAATDQQAFFDAYPYRVEPVTDDRPFFFQYSRLSDLGAALRRGGTSLSQVSLFVTLVLALLLAAAIVLLPLRGVAPTGRWRPVTALYFAALGTGFMLVEIPLIQRFTLYLGHPTQALVTILSSLLVFASIGSLAAGRLRLGWPAIAGVIACAVLTAAAIPAVPAVTHATMGLSTPARIAICLALLFPIAFSLGLPLALGMRAIAERGAGAVAWAWAVNGAASVVAACLAMIVLVYFGFAAALASAAAAYLVAALALRAITTAARA